MSSPDRPEVRLALPLEDFSLEVDLRVSSRVAGVFGPSGAGKTSLLEAIAGLRREARGRITFGDEVWLDSETGVFQAPEKRRIGYVPQDGLLFPHLDVRQNLLVGVRRAASAASSSFEALESVAELLELGHLLTRHPMSLSGGERQRVALGRALCSSPRLLLLDEPMGSLDLPLRRRLLPMLRRVSQELEVPMLLISHDPVEIQALCQEVFALNRGRIVAEGAPTDVLGNPEVFPLAPAEGFENVLQGVLTASGGGTSRLRLGPGGGAELVVPRVDARLGTEVLVSLPAHEVLISTGFPTGLSARNILPAQILAVEPLGELRLVRAALDDGGPTLSVEVTPDACESLGFVPELPVFLVIKTTGCRVYWEGPRNT